MSNANNIPQVGTHGSFGIGSDSYPCTVIAVSPSGHRVTVQEDRVVRYTPFPDSVGVEFERDTNGRTTVFTRRRNGRYREAGANYGGLSLGEWAAHRDPSF